MKKIILCSIFMFNMLEGSVVAAEMDQTDPAEGEVQSVSVHGTKDPELKPYKIMKAGLDAFEANRRLAPSVEVLKFVLRPNTTSVSLDGVTLKIVSKEDEIPISISKDGMFVLPNVKSAAETDADLILNRNKKFFGVLPVVRSPAVPKLMRRLGDLRLECEVSLALGKKELNFAARAALFMMAGGNICKYKKGHFMYEAPAPFDNFTLVFEGRRMILQSGSKQKSFDAPIADQTWPDDTLIEFQFSENK